MFHLSYKNEWLVLGGNNDDDLHNGNITKSSKDENDSQDNYNDSDMEDDGDDNRDGDFNCDINSKDL